MSTWKQGESTGPTEHTTHEPGTRRCVGRSGYTLAELLIVISIVALLLAMLMPSLQKARSQGRAASCGSTLRGLTDLSLIQSKELRTTA